MTDATENIQIPADLKPVDGRFGAGPSKIRPESVAALAATGETYLGTSHRRPGVRGVVGQVRAGITDLFELPDGYEVVLGNGGATAFWDIATFGLIKERSQHLQLRRVLQQVRQRSQGGTVSRRPDGDQVRAGHAPAAAGRSRRRRVRAHP